MTKKPSDASARVKPGKPAPGKAAPTRAARQKATSKAAGAKTANAASPYHHGALRDALLQAAERVLERDGLSGLTLRAVAREAGVSHAAPTHHFGDLTGLVSELAAIGFRQFNATMAAAGDSGTTLLEKGMANAKAYVAYARTHPGLYALMFRSPERLDHSRPSLHEASEAAFAGLAGSVAASRQEQISEESLSLDQAAAIARNWSLVHGFTMLLLDGSLGDILHRLPEGTTAEILLDAMIARPSVARPGLMAAMAVARREFRASTCTIWGRFAGNA